MLEPSIIDTKTGERFLYSHAPDNVLKHIAGGYRVPRAPDSNEHHDYAFRQWWAAHILQSRGK